MRIDAITIRNQPPVHNFEASGLSSVVVVAGPNGIGKTRLMNGIINLLRNPGSGGPQAYLSVIATTQSEMEAWKTETLATTNPAHAQLLSQTLQRNRNLGFYRFHGKV